MRKRYLYDLLWSGLNNIFYWKVHLVILFKLLLSCLPNGLPEKVSSLTFVKSDLSAANVLHIAYIPFAKSLI